MKFFLILVVSLIPGIIFGQLYCPAEEILQGPVIKVKTELYSRKRNILSGLEELPITLKVSSTTIIENGKIILKSFKYPSGELKCFCTNKYDDYNNLSERIIYAPDSLIDVKKVFSYNNGQLIRTEYYNRKNQLFSTRVYQIDSTGYSAISMELFDEGYEDLSYIKLNNDFLPVKYYTADSSGVKDLYKSIEYDSLKRVAKQVNYFENKIASHFSNKYDDFSRIIETLWYDNHGFFIGKDSTAYDEYSNITYFRKDNAINSWASESFTYEYDKYGNYVSKMSWIGIGSSRKLVSKELRTITYE